MNTLEFLIPTALAFCLGGAMNNYGPCDINPPRVTGIKYYEPEKSCYINGTFYSRCGDGLRDVNQSQRKH